MPSYMDALTQEQPKHVDGAIDAFLTRYKNFGIARGNQQKTVLFFPGGLGSELSRADAAFDSTSGANYAYNQFWYDVAQIQGLGAALWLQMRREDGVDYDTLPTGGIRIGSTQGRFVQAGRITMPRSWIPFGIGPRVCIGGTFATMEVLVVLRCLLARYRIGLQGASPRPIGRVTLLPDFEPLFTLTPL